MHKKSYPFHAIFRNERIARGLSQAELAKESSVSIPMLQLIEAGKANPSLETVRKLNQCLGLELSITPRFSKLEQLLAHFDLILSEASTFPLRLNAQTLRIWIKEIEEYEASKEADARLKEAWLGFRLSLIEYFPSFAKKVPMKPSEGTPSGRMIKLKRMALPRLIEILKA